MLSVSFISAFMRAFKFICSRATCRRTRPIRRAGRINSGRMITLSKVRRQSRAIMIANVAINEIESLTIVTNVPVTAR